jgi:hypothetical protein
MTKEKNEPRGSRRGHRDPEKRKGSRFPGRAEISSDEEPGGRAGAIPELIRRATALGLSSFFATEEAVRRAVGDTLPQDWIDFATQQSERTRSEFIDRISQEFGKLVEDTNLAEMIEQLLEGRDIEVSARIRLGKREQSPNAGEAKTEGTKIEFTVAGGRKGRR